MRVFFYFMPLRILNCYSSEAKVGDRIEAGHYLSKTTVEVPAPFKSFWSLSFPQNNINYLSDPISFLSTVTRRVGQGVQFTDVGAIPERALYIFFVSHYLKNLSDNIRTHHLCLFNRFHPYDNASDFSMGCSARQSHLTLIESFGLSSKRGSKQSSWLIFHRCNKGREITLLSQCKLRYSILYLLIMLISSSNHTKHVFT